MKQKPNVQKLFEAFQQFAIASSRAHFNKSKWDEARAELKRKLDDLGVGQSFDWSEE